MHVTWDKREYGFVCLEEETVLSFSHELVRRVKNESARSPVLFHISEKKEGMILPHQPQFFCWGNHWFSFLGQSTAPSPASHCEHCANFFWDGGKGIFFLVIRLAAIKCVLGLSRRVSGVPLENLCYCSMRGGGSVPQVELCREYRAALALEWWWMGDEAF